MPSSYPRAFSHIAILAWVLLPLLVDAQSIPVVGSPRVEQEVHHDTSPPLYLIPPAPRHIGKRVHDIELLPRAIQPSAEDTAVQLTYAAALTPGTMLNIDGVGDGFTGPNGTFTVNSIPPDTNGAVGPNHYVHIVNTDFAIFNKSGTVIRGPLPINTLWSKFGGGCETNNDGDPVVVYDRMADRFVFSQFSVSTLPYLQCVAVSQTGDPTGSYNRYSFSYGNTDFPDYPKMGVWPDAYYETFNIFHGNTFFTGRVCAYDRAKMLAGQSATQHCFDVGSNFGGLLPASLDGATLPPAGSPNYILALGVSNDDLAFWKFHVDFTTPSNSTLTGPATIIVAAYNALCNGGACVTQTGTTQKLDSLADRIMHRLAYRNFGTHESLVTNHSVNPGSGGGVRWYEIRSPGTTPTVFQQGTFAPDSNFRWMGSIAMDQSGNMAVGYSRSGGSLNPGIHYTGRVPSDPLGTMETESTIIDGSGSQLPFTCTSGPCGQRWGDYSAMQIDPSDDCTFWYTNEYIPSNGTFNWKTRIGTFKFPGCGTPTNDFSISANPTSVTLNQGAGGSTTILTAVTSGSAETVTFSISGLPAGATASFNPPSVTAGNNSTLNLNAGTAAPGVFTLTVTGTAPSATHSTSVTLTVIHNDFSISANPTSLSLAPGTGGSSTISTAQVSGGSETINLTVSGVPGGATASLNPTSVATGGSSTLNVSAGTAAPGVYTLTVKGTAPSATHSTSVTLTVTRAPAITSANNTTFTVGTLGSFTVTTTGVPTPAITESGALPNGVSFVDNGNGTGKLSGTPASGTNGVYNITFTASNGVNPNATQNFTLTVNAASSAPTLSSLNPSSNVQGAIFTDTLMGTNFIAGAKINIAGSGVSASNVTVVNSTTITATFTVATNATLGAHNVSVTTSGGTSGTVAFTVNPAPGPPTLTSISPGYVIQNTATTVTLTGTNFVPGNTTINNSYTGLSISNVMVVSSTSLTATFTVAANAPIGSTTFSVTTPSGTSGNNVGIDVIGVPILTSISPNNGNRGTAFTVTLTGSKFLRAQIKFSGTGITASNRTVNFPMFTVLTYTFTIASNAPTGPQNVTLTNAAGTSAPKTFTVN